MGNNFELGIAINIPGLSTALLDQPSLYNETITSSHSPLCSVYKATGPSKLVWRLCGGSLLCTSKKISELCVRVISEELAYNRALKQFKIFIVERPLDPSHKVNMRCLKGGEDYSHLYDTINSQELCDTVVIFLCGLHNVYCIKLGYFGDGGRGIIVVFLCCC